MTYLQFHLVFLLPPLLLLGWLARGRARRVHPRAPMFIALLAVIAFVYTTPWDNYLVWRGVWRYGEERVLGTLGYVPVEEYLFFLLQPLLTGLWLLWVLRTGDPRAADGQNATGGWAVRAAGALVYLAAAAGGVAALGHARGTYLGLILAWAAPVLMLQWAWAGAEFWRRRRAFALGVAVPTLYLWVADAVAIRLGIWWIEPRLSTGILLWGLPVEEALFFLVTNLLVVQGLMLFLFPPTAPAPLVIGRRSSVVGHDAPDRRRMTDDRRGRVETGEHGG